MAVKMSIDQKLAGGRMTVSGSRTAPRIRCHGDAERGCGRALRAELLKSVGSLSRGPWLGR